MKKNEIIEVLIDDIGANGEGIAHYEHYTVFVPFAMANEKCKVLVLKVKDSIVFAKLQELINESNARCKPECKYFTKCGGCTLQHVSSGAEIEAKKNIIYTSFRKYAGICLDNIKMVDSDKLYGYRNKCAFPIREINGAASVCMFRQNSHSPIKIESCPLADNLINSIISIVDEWIQEFKISAYSEETKKGLLKFLVCRVLNNKALITLVVNNQKVKYISELCEKLKNNKILYGLNLNVNSVDNNVILSDKFIYVDGFEELQGEDYGIVYPISSMSFMQVNDDVKNKIYNKVLENINADSVVIDAYSGAGLMSAMIAKKAKKVYGVEIIKQATKNANDLAKNNKIDNLVNINGDCSKILPNLVKEINNENIQIVLDPPRKGCDRKVLEAVIKADADSIVYVSCNPATLARDAKILLDSGYLVQEIWGFNMFPQTYHVESLLVLKKGETS